MLPTQNQTPVREVDAAWLAPWLKVFQDQQVSQTKYLRNISTVATLIGLLIILGFVLGACSVLMGVY